MSNIEEIIKPLSQSGEDLFWHGQASEASVQKVEELLGVKLPISLRSFLLKFGGGGVVGEEISGIEDNNPSLLNKGTILGDTERCRKEYRLPSDLAVVYFTDEGVCWCVDCSKRDKAGESPVVSYSIFAHRIDSEIASAFSFFLKQYVELRASR